MSAPQLLILGYRPQLMRAARQMSISTVVVYGPWEKEHWPPSDRVSSETCVFVENPGHTEAVLAALVRRFSRPRFCAVVPASDEYVPAAASLSILLTNHAVGPWDALAWKDKVLQKAAVRRAGVSTVLEEILEDISDLPAPSCAATYPAIVKPIAGQATSNTALVENEGQLKEWMQRALSRTVRRSFILEPFVSGPELQLDGVVKDGCVEFLSVGEYRNNPLQIVRFGAVEGTYVLDPTESATLYETAMVFAQQVVAALKIKNSVFHLEAFHQPDGSIVFGECGVRLGGAFTPEMVCAKFGVDLSRAYLEVVCGLPLTLKVCCIRETVAKTYLPTIPGTLRSCPAVEEVRQRPGVTYAEIQHPIGSKLLPMSTNSAVRLGEAIVVGKSRQEVNQRIDELIDWFKDRVYVQ